MFRNIMGINTTVRNTIYIYYIFKIDIYVLLKTSDITYINL